MATQTINIKLVESLTQAIDALSIAEQNIVRSSCSLCMPKLKQLSGEDVVSMSFVSSFIMNNSDT